ncbi:hypothetical protein ACHAXA_008943 [Cyclostephanos tholiformis]|uniref:SET domain-containing protein n=1 Tax=Cyclostephanos tholiformis TaxID=382380 RepID=A0ABD3RG54_9STRA
MKSPPFHIMQRSHQHMLCYFSSTYLLMSFCGRERTSSNHPASREIAGVWCKMVKEKCKKTPSLDASRKATKSDEISIDDGISGVKGGLEGISLSSSETGSNDVSSFLFHSKSTKPSFRLPFLGPISLSERGSIGAKISHGRGLITTRDVSSGECLFVIPSIFSADAVEVRTRYLQEKINGGDQAKVVERLAEDHIVQKVQAACDLLSDEEIQPSAAGRARIQLNAFILQMNSERVLTIENPAALMGNLVANESSTIPPKDTVNLDKGTILGIIRRNGFGPDFHNYNKIATCWTERANSEHCYNRVLGIYPLAAMINHSCCPNAVRVFGSIPTQNGIKSKKEVMIAHANANIPNGTEITWSYISPATPFAVRREMLLSKYGFTCHCPRCAMEDEAISKAEFQGLFALADRRWSTRDSNLCDQRETAISLVSSIERIFSTNQIPIESQRYLRVSYGLVRFLWILTSELCSSYCYLIPTAVIH